MLYGKKSERLIPETSPNQLSIFKSEAPASEPEEKKHIQDACKKRKAHPGRNEVPEYLPLEEIVLEPEESTKGLRKIGEEVTETREYMPASFGCKRVIRTQYAKADWEGMLIAQLPSRPIEQGMAEASLLAHILVNKFVDHLPS